MDSDRELDVAVFGATGFAGRLVVAYLADHAPTGTRIGLAGRSAARLEEVRAGLGATARDWPLLVADSADPASLAALARSARVVATTVGPYWPHGLALVAACADAGTDYADLSGEVLFERESINRYLGRERDLTRVRYDDSVGSWVGPFIMASINTRVVRRSNALQDWAYGRRFRYQEVTGFGPGPAGSVRASTFTAGLGALAAGLAFPPSRRLLSRVLPDPGAGPSEKTRRSGYFRMRIHARTSAGRHYVAKVAGRGDPGYQATAVMFGESALCLVLDRDRLPAVAGVLTPATAMGPVLAGRLRSAGMTLAAEPV